MKYIKKYENLSITYKKNDYILLDLDKMRKRDEEMSTEFISDEDVEDAEIFWKKLNPPYAKIYLIFDRGYANYRVVFYDNTCFDVEENEIIRHLTQDEMDTYEVMKNSIKYNL